MTVLGKNTTGGSTGLLLLDYLYCAGPFTPAANGTVDDFNINLVTPNAGTKVVLGVYQDNGSGQPGAKIGQSLEIDPAASGWNQIGTSGTVSLTAGTDYWIAYQADTQPTSGGISRASGQTGSSLWFQGSQTYNATLPSTFPGSPPSELADYLDSVYLNFTEDAGTLASGALSVSSIDDGEVNLSVEVATGGTSPYAYQFHRGTTPDFTPAVGTQIGTASATRTHQDGGLTNGTVYYYKCVVTDNDSTQVTSNMIPAVPATPKGWLFIGDSFGDYVWNGAATEVNEFAMGRQLADMLNAAQSDKSVVHSVSNEAVSGASASQWVATHLANAMAAAPSASFPNVIIMLGLNDSFQGASESSHKASMQSIITTLRSNSYTDIVLCYPPLVWWGTLESEAEQARLNAYRNAIDELFAENSDITVVSSLFAHVPNNTGDFGFADDDIHPVEEGGAHLAASIASEIVGGSTTISTSATAADVPQVTRSTTDTTALRFSFPTNGATITGTRKIDAGTEEAVDGAITAADTGLAGNWYELAYDADDRPSGPGYVYYEFTDGTDSVEVLLVVEVGGGGDATLEKQNETYNLLIEKNIFKGTGVR